MKIGYTKIFRAKRSDWLLRNVMVFLVRDGGPGQLSWYSDSLGHNIPGIESRWGQDFPHPSTSARVPTEPPVKWVPGRGVDHPLPI